jgi:hypothetical protein
MTKKKKIQGNCALCGEFKKLSFEHVPPAAAFNDKPIFIQGHEHLMNEKSYLFGKKMKSNKGFGGYTLCEPCNNNTGDWYARDFAEFAHQGMEIIKKTKPQYIIQGLYTIKPLNVIKQILTMFMSADKSGHLRSQKDLVEFLMNKESVGMPEKYSVFLYSNLSQKKRMMGYSIVYNPKLGIQKWSEINFHPFGYLLAEESKAAHEHMCDISNFGNIEYDKVLSMIISTAYLNVESEWIGTYK